ncbi:aldehyde dehydrogenase family protein [Jatrophihabitans sp. YIM 134969]
MTDDATRAVREVATAAAAAGAVLRTVPDTRVAAALRTAAALVQARSEEVLAANAVDVDRATASGMSAGLLDRLRLDPARLEQAARALVQVADTPVPPALTHVRDLDDGTAVWERRLPVGVIGATYEARPAVTLDVASQVLRAGSAAVLRTGSAALGTSAVLVDRVLVPALADTDLPPTAVGLVRHPGHDSAEALVAQPDLLPLVIVRGSGDTTRHLAHLGAAAGVRVLAHADGGGILYADRAADEGTLQRLIDAGTDRLGVCNRLNLLLIHRGRWDDLLPVVEKALSDKGIAVSAPPHSHALGWEWALDSEHEATVTVAPVDDALDAVRTGLATTSGIAATICTEDTATAGEFLGAWGGTGGFWNTTTRLLDGFKLLGVPETGISVDRVPGPRGPVTSSDLVLRQFVVVPAGRDVPFS